MATVIFVINLGILEEWHFISGDSIYREPHGAYSIWALIHFINNTPHPLPPAFELKLEVENLKRWVCLSEADASLKFVLSSEGTYCGVMVF